MYKRLFINVFFEKKKVLLFFFVILMVVFTYVGVKVVLVDNSLSKVASPDIVVYGALDNNIMGFKYYNPIGGMSDEFKSTDEKDELKVYGMVSRNIQYVQDVQTLREINYTICGVEETFLENEIKKHVKNGRLPKDGEKEAIIGGSAARFYDVAIGDKLNIPVTLVEDFSGEDILQYTVVGILDDRVDYFTGTTFISKETFETINNAGIPENMMMVYFKGLLGQAEYQSIIEKLNDISPKYQMGGMNTNYYIKYNAMRNSIIDIIVFLVSGVFIIFLLVLYLMKGITKKVGLLKALGLLDKYMLKAFAGGLGIVICISMLISFALIIFINMYLNHSVSQFLGYSVTPYSVGRYVYLLILLVAVIMFVSIISIIRHISLRISPRDAMLKR